MKDQNLEHIACELGECLTQRGFLLVSAESCTGGWIGQTITAIAGSSKWYERGFITYSDLSKQEMLGVSHLLLAQSGAVSEKVAIEMAAGAISRSHAQVSMAVTGIAGPGGGTAVKPVGMVCFAWAIKNSLSRSEVHYLDGDREAVRRKAVAIALQGTIDLLRDMSLAVA